MLLGFWLKLIKIPRIISLGHTLLVENLAPYLSSPGQWPCSTMESAGRDLGRVRRGPGFEFFRCNSKKNMIQKLFQLILLMDSLSA